MSAMPIHAPEILIIETEEKLRHTLTALIGSLGYRTFAAASAAQAARRAETEPDLIILDLAAADIDGSQAIPELRKIFAAAPILVTSHRGDTGVKVAALDAGADDFLTKPINLEELGARVRAMLRRCMIRPETRLPIRIGEFELDAEKRSVTLRERSISFSRKEFDLLQIFARHAGKVLTHRFLVSQMWNEQVDSQYVRVYVSQIRSKIEANPAKPRYLVTEPGTGYVFHSTQQDRIAGRI